MNVAIAGVSGFVGSFLKEYFLEREYQVVAISRATFSNQEALEEIINWADVVINLAGENILKRWSSSYKRKLLESRVKTTMLLVEAMNRVEKEQLLISSSAIGIYENNLLCDEEDYIYGETFLSYMCQEWEKEAKRCKQRTVIFRLGVVLGEGGALHKMMLPFKAGLGGAIGDGTQAFSFVHIEDLARAYEHVILHDALEGVFNLSSPKPSTNAKFTKSLAKKLHRPALVPVPQIALKAVYGEGAQVLCEGQAVYPKRLLETGFSFEYEDAESALEDLVL
jgi:uncharacterized protein (TIGR01777 family)